MAVVSPRGAFISVNDGLCMFGRSADALGRLNVSDVTFSDDLHLTVAAENDLLDGPATAALTTRYLHHSGGVLHAQVKASALYAEDSSLHFLILQIQDATGQAERTAGSARPAGGTLEVRASRQRRGPVGLAPAERRPVPLGPLEGHRWVHRRDPRHHDRDVGGADPPGRPPRPAAALHRARERGHRQLRVRAPHAAPGRPLAVDAGARPGLVPRRARPAAALDRHVEGYRRACPDSTGTGTCPPRPQEHPGSPARHDRVLGTHRAATASATPRTASGSVRNPTR